ncbi:MAG: tRNA (adenosine(37)-N6)-threonylcarbamoyltransferase complex transferase subunit TsaD, partial [Armatimonadetes bacterium]|nr:tRNA (adenosine(37)-N6)-threonylcarbamoyltransferase complex transferase subunit TsaD [Armatimonadota bacterium]
MRILGIETSCDETAAAVLDDGRLRSNVIASQTDLHHRYGGIVPELASRRHLETLLPVIEEALAGAGVTLPDIDAVAVTCGPGLVGALTVGVAAAKAIAFGLGVPLVGVNHLEGHIYANFLEHGPLPLPLVALIVSGAHSDLVLMHDHGRYDVLGRTRDDAAGEAFDKVARAMGLGYPGGPAIDRLARHGNDAAVPLPMPVVEGDRLDFSFSGIKTAVLRVLERQPAPTEAFLADLAAAFERVVVGALVEKTVRATRRHRPRALVLAGGVASNTRLRDEFARAAQELGLSHYRPSPVLCTDNAAMNAAAGEAALGRGRRDTLSLAAHA